MSDLELTANSKMVGRETSSETSKQTSYFSTDLNHFAPLKFILATLHHIFYIKHLAVLVLLPNHRAFSVRTKQGRIRFYYYEFLNIRSYKTNFVL